MTFLILGHNDVISTTICGIIRRLRLFVPDF